MISVNKWMQCTGQAKRLCVFGGRGRGLRVFGGLCVDMWRLVHQWSFLLFWLSFDCFDCFWRLVHCTNRQKQSKHRCTNRCRSTKTVPTTNSVPTVYQSSNNSQKQSTQQKWPLVYQSSHVCTESVEYTKSASAVHVCVRRIHKANQKTGTGPLLWTSAIPKVTVRIRVRIADRNSAAHVIHCCHR